MINLVSPRVITHNVDSFMQHKDHDVNVGCHLVFMTRQCSTRRELVVFNSVFSEGVSYINNLYL